MGRLPSRLVEPGTPLQVALTKAGPDFFGRKNRAKKLIEKTSFFAVFSLAGASRRARAHLC
jgi:hypothetical protein